MDGPYNLKKLNTSSIKLNKIKVKFDLNTLDLIIAFIYKDSVLKTRKTLTNINRFINSIDMSLYEIDPITGEEAVDLKSRLWIIRKSLIGRLEEGLDDPNTLMTFCLDDVDCNDYIKGIIMDIPNKKISHDESKFLIRKIDDALEFGYTVTIKEIMQELLNKIDDEEFKSYKSIEDDLYSIATAIINVHRYTRSLDSDQTFSLDSDIFEQVVEDAVQKLKDRNRIFTTGIRRLNTFLAPGFMSKRLYLFLAFPGKGKSMMLLKCARDIKKYNKNIKTKDPEKRPAVLFLTLENDIAETVERLYNMTVDSDDIRNYTPKQIKNRMRKEGQLTLSSDDNIDIIIKEYKNREIDTNDIYSIIDDYSDEGIEIIALVVDYIKRLRPAEKGETEKEELKNISNELKEIAKAYDITVITAQQLNRSGAAVVDAALQANKQDVTRLVGRDAIASSWELLENADMTIIINPEIKVDTGERYMTFKLLKRRYRSVEENEKLRTLDYFNHPFEPGNDIKLIDDVEMPQSLSLESLANSFGPDDKNTENNKVTDSRGTKNATVREDKTEKVNAKQLADTFDAFDFAKAINY